MKRPENISEKAQLISGIGASSWFTIKQENEYFRIERFSPDGELECSRLFDVTPSSFDVKQPFEFTYLSHCKECTIIQNEVTYKFYTNEY
ncbi:hypothetical protein N9B89_02780 [Flavobacteriales bacterium]|jgi:hypothetical protein|nr:hypothetical protein [Flavobacteriales bacterium]